MAVLVPVPLLLLLLSVSQLVPISHAATKAAPCTSYKFTDNKTFDKCTNLDHLGASLHYTYNTDGTLSIAFIAAPASPNGWVAWGINPDSDTMIGTQALIAYKSTGGMTVKTFNISSYAIQPSPILYKTSDLSAVFGSDGKIVLFAKLSIGKSIGSVNQVYQVGSMVTNGVPDKHALSQDNLDSKGELTLTGTALAATAPASAPGPSDGSSTTDTAPSAPSNNEASSPGASKNAARRSNVSALWSIVMALLVGYMVRFF